MDEHLIWISDVRILEDRLQELDDWLEQEAYDSIPVADLCDGPAKDGKQAIDVSRIIDSLDAYDLIDDFFEEFATAGSRLAFSVHCSDGTSFFACYQAGEHRVYSTGVSIDTIFDELERSIAEQEMNDSRSVGTLGI